MPPVNIPGPGSTPTAPRVPGIPSPSSKIGKDVQFELIGDDGTLKTFPNGKSGLLVLDFMTTRCLACEKSLPGLMELHKRYAEKGVEIVSVVCDSARESRRVELARYYREDHRIPFAVMAECTGSAAIQQRFGVELYPTIVLLDSQGRRLWSGDHRQLAELDRVIAARLSP
jgi:thiol-disulfide isomerase/thioredoxin